MLFFRNEGLKWQAGGEVVNAHKQSCRDGKFFGHTYESELQAWKNADTAEFGG